MHVVSAIHAACQLYIAYSPSSLRAQGQDHGFYIVGGIMAMGSGFNPKILPGFALTEAGSIRAKCFFLP